MSFFPSDYFHSREQFRLAAFRNGYLLENHPLAAKGPEGRALTMDVAIRPAHGPTLRTLVVFSGLHGIEGFFGAAVQHRLLQETPSLIGGDVGLRIVLVHAVNPFGFAWHRRFNEDNVDLNRNFLLPGENFAGAPPTYEKLAQLIAPESPPRKPDLFLPQALVALLREGPRRAVSEIPAGQYEFPQGLFFGGKGKSESQKVLESHLDRWIGQDGRVLLLDLHTGIFKRGEYYLLQDFETRPPDQDAFESFFRNIFTDAMRSSSLSYRSRGTLARWASRRFREREFHYLVAEFGTMNELRVLGRLRAENRNHWWGEGQRMDHWSKRELLEAFLPSDPLWRQKSMAGAWGIVDESLAWLRRGSG